MKVEVGDLVVITKQIPWNNCSLNTHYLVINVTPYLESYTVWVLGNDGEKTVVLSGMYELIHKCRN